jgi:hypothetical protein
LIKLNEDRKDRRYLNILLSEAGATLINKYHTLCEDKIRHVLSHFNEKEKDIFHQMLDKYIFYFINDQENLALFCMQCGGKYEGSCMIGAIKNKCFFNMQDR